MLYKHFEKVKIGRQTFLKESTVLHGSVVDRFVSIKSARDGGLVATLRIRDDEAGAVYASMYGDQAAEFARLTPGCRVQLIGNYARNTARPVFRIREYQVLEAAPEPDEGENPF